MSQDAITFHIDADKLAELDAVAIGLGCDRTHILNAAIDLFLEVHRWQAAHTLEGIRQADAEELASDDEVYSSFQRWGDPVA